MSKAERAENLFGLIGFPLSHSFSKRYFSDKFQRERITNAYYELFPIAKIEQLPGLLSRYPNLKGLNVTIPYKQAVIPYLSRLDEGAAAIGAVNTIYITEEQALIGYNTDLYGFENSLYAWLLNERKGTAGLQALILGTGGAAKAVAYALKRLEIPHQLVSRKPGADQIGYGDLPLAEAHLIINTTPLGMSPHTEHCPQLEYAQLGPQHYLYDLVYNPEQTLFMKKGAAQGAKVKNGMEMLIGQAEKAWQIWQSDII
jgi:shikimate dehydrogenase